MSEEYGDKRPALDAFMRGDIVQVRANINIVNKLHGCIGVVREVIHNRDEDHVEYIDDLRVVFTEELNQGNEEKYNEWIHGRSHGLMLFPHEVIKIEPRQTWEL